MKKKKGFIGVLCSFVIGMVFSMTAMAAETDDIFPIMPGSAEWESFTTKQEMLDVCQIPEEKLQGMTTETLLETVLAYPLITDYNAFNSIEDACEVMSNDFNGFYELFLRSDVTSQLLRQYSNAKVLAADEVKTAETGEFFKPATLEYLIACDEIKNGAMTEEETAAFYALHKIKSEKREGAGIYSEASEIYSSYKRGALTRAGEIWTPVAAGTVKTPKGNNVEEVYKRSPELTQAEKDEMNNDFAMVYPRATRKADPTIKYNCHSYAWYQQSVSNPYWIGRNSRPSIYTTDGSYVRYTGTPSSGMKAWYNSGEHSGISIGTKVESGKQVQYVESKWGQAALYEHPADYSPYTPSIAWYTR